MQYWPPNVPRTLAAPPLTLPQMLEASAERGPAHSAIHFFGRSISYSELLREAKLLTSWLQRLGIGKGDRVMLYLQNSPQWIIGYFAILLADAVVVPVNPMSRTPEFLHFAQSSGAKAVICSEELAEIAVSAAPPDVTEIIVATYAEYLPAHSEFDLPAWISSPPRRISGCTPWSHALSSPNPSAMCTASPDDLAVLSYTSGSLGAPKGCMHTHQSFMHSIAGLCVWHAHDSSSVFLGAAPFYQTAGLVSTLNSAIYSGASLVPIPRWDGVLVSQLISQYRVSFAGLAPAAIRDLLKEPEAIERLSSLTRLSSGGSTMPSALWHQIEQQLGQPFIEVYGMTETGTIAINPIERPKPQCLGVPFFGTDIRVLEPNGLDALQQGHAGEFVVHGPQLFRGYWNSTTNSDDAFVEIEGRRFFRTGDIGYVDPEGYLFMTDRLKRMINASGYKVWPAEVEGVLSQHPAVLECCVVGAPDPVRGETVKALVVRRDVHHEGRQSTTEADLIAWTRDRMAAYKYPRSIEFVTSLPKSPAGKMLWRELQNKEYERARSNSLSISSEG